MTNGATMAISDKLARIRRLADELSAETDLLNDSIRQIERGLQGTGVEFWWNARPLGKRASRGEDGLKERSYYILGYAKVGSEWCLAAQPWCDVEPTAGHPENDWDNLEDGEVVALTRAPRRIRAAAAEVLESFLEAFAVEVESTRKVLAKANAIASDKEFEDVPREIKIAVARKNAARAERKVENSTVEAGQSFFDDLSRKR